MVSSQAGSFIQSFTPLATTGTLFEFDINQKGVVYYGITATLSGGNVTYSGGPSSTECDFAIARYLAVQADQVYRFLGYAPWASPNWDVNSL
jgi:hypothetical protein